jgi:hypothetical protein
VDREVHTTAGREASATIFGAGAWLERIQEGKKLDTKREVFLVGCDGRDFVDRDQDDCRRDAGGRNGEQS